MSGTLILTTEFIGCASGPWRVRSISPIIGASIDFAPYLDIHNSGPPINEQIWTLKGVASHARYTTREEKNKLISVQASLGRPESSLAALIPIKKSDAWWELTQEERREIFESKSKHIANSMKYATSIARKLYHSRDLGESFDFLTWFEFSPEQEGEFNELLKELRSSEEWKYVSREVDIRLSKTESYNLLVTE